MNEFSERPLGVVRREAVAKTWTSGHDRDLHRCQLLVQHANHRREIARNLLLIDRVIRKRRAWKTKVLHVSARQKMQWIGAKEQHSCDRRAVLAKVKEAQRGERLLTGAVIGGDDLGR